MVKVTISKDFIGAIIGPGGKNIQALQEMTETTIVINEEDDMGIVEILGTSQEGIDNAIQSIKNSTFEPVVGETYKVKVTKMLDFGAVIEFVPGKDSLLHISEFDWKRIEKPTDVLNLGDVIKVKYIGIDPKTKKPKVSRKALMPRPPKPEHKDKPRENNDK